MKKLISLILTVFTVTVLFAVARPSLDGRAVVADEGDMPKGLFARTIGYLPGDSVTVTNPATGSTVDVLILGAIDASEGVAIRLSPEAADRLNIKKDSNVQVKITKRTGSLDETVSGTAVLAEEDGETDYIPGSELDENVSSTAENITDENDINDDNPAVNEDDSVSDFNNTQENDVTEPEAEENSEETDFFADDEDVKALENISEETELPPADENVAEESVEIDPPAASEVPAEVVSEEVPEVEDDVPSEKVDETAPELEEYVEEAVKNEFPPETETSDIESEAEGEEETVLTPESEASETEAVNEEIPSADEQDNIAEKTEPDEIPEPEELNANKAVEETDEESYQPIIIIPSEPNPPEETEEAAESPAFTEVVDAAENTAPVEIPSETAAVVEEPSLAVAAAQAAEKEIDIDSYIKASLKDLESGKYYIQIATLSNMDNIHSLLEKYSEKYPVVLVPLTSGKAYQVLVGPLTGDEYGAVIERFREHGFKDCFLRKIK